MLSIVGTRIYICEGDECSLRLMYKNSDGDLFNFRVNDSLKLVIKDSKRNILMTKESKLLDLEDKSITVVIFRSSDYDVLRKGDYYYDLIVTTPTNTKHMLIDDARLHVYADKFSSVATTSEPLPDEDICVASTPLVSYFNCAPDSDNDIDGDLFSNDLILFSESRQYTTSHKVAYGNREDIEPAIEAGVIPPGCLIMTENSNEMYFYDLERNLQPYEERYKFQSYEEATQWVEKYDCKGQILSVHEEDKCNLYIVDYNNELSRVGGLSAPASSTPPEDPEQGQMYIDNSTEPPHLYWYDGTKWVMLDNDVTTDDEFIELLKSEDMLPAVADSDGCLLSDENGNILLW